MRLVSGIVAIGIMGLVWLIAGPSAGEPTRLDRYWVKVVFGIDGKEAKWDGALTVTDGKALSMAEWGLEERDRLLPAKHAWKITTGIPKVQRVTYAEPTRGFLVEIEASSDTTLKITTQQGEFAFKPAQLTPGQPTKLLEGRVLAERLGSALLVAPTQTDDDYPALAIDARGQRQVMWIAYDHDQKRNHLLLRNLDDPNSQPVSIAREKEFASPHLFAGPEGLHALWCSPGKNGNWDIYHARQPAKDSPPKGSGTWDVTRVTSAAGTDFQLGAQQARDGSLWIAWQSFRAGNGDIYAQHYRDGKWAATDIVIASTPANEWQPALDVDEKGQAWIAYDTYEHGNYDIYLTSIRVAGNKYSVGDRQAIARSADFEAHASVLCDAGRVWVAYDAAGPSWGKDFRNGATTDKKTGCAEPLHASRRLELRCVQDGKVFKPAAALPQILPRLPVKNISRTPTQHRFYEYPQLAKDGEGRLWIFFRMCRQGYCPHPPRGIDWRFHVTTFTNQGQTGGWLEPIELPKSQGRQEQRLAWVVGPDKLLHAAWADGNRFASVDRKYGLYAGRLPVIDEPRKDIPLVPVQVDPPAGTDKVTVTPWKLKQNGKEFQLYYGDMHRHTNISRCMPTIDGCLTDAHRYALDAVKLDFLAITDHTRDVDPFSWWRTQQAADHYLIPGTYVPIYAYERSNNTPTGGHRNVFFIKRGWEVNPSDHWYLGRNLKPKDTRPDRTLYPWMKKKGGALTAAHTPGYAAGAKSGTWTFHDPQAEPVAEVYQSFRRSYERPEKGVQEQASLWYALKQGYKLGFIASSDHLATHTSYACIWAEDKTREALFEGLQARRTFGATDRIALDIRIGDAVMGEETQFTGKQVTVKIRALGTAPIEEIQVVRSGEVIARLHPNQREVHLESTDRAPLAGESYYYVRLLQSDGGMAWASPIWIRR